MANLVITIISIALVAIAAIAVIWYGFMGYQNSQIQSTANQIVNDIQNIDVAVQLMIANNAAPAAQSGTSSNQISSISSYVSSIPTPPTNIIQSPYNNNPYELYFLTPSTYDQRRYLIRLLIGQWNGGSVSNYNVDPYGNSWTNENAGTNYTANIGRQVCGAVQKNNQAWNSLQNRINNGLGQPYMYIETDQRVHGLDCWLQRGGWAYVYISISRPY